MQQPVRRPSNTLSLRGSQPAARGTADFAPSSRQQTRHPDSVVYLIQEPTIPKHSGKVLDTTPLLWWGKVSVVIPRGASPSFNPDAALATIRHRLAEYDPSKDYIAIAGGDTLAVMLVGAVLREQGHDYVTYLRFERTRLPDGSRDPAHGAYVPIRVPLVPTQG